MTRADLGPLAAAVAAVAGAWVGERLGAGSGMGAITAAAAVAGGSWVSGRFRGGVLLAVVGLASAAFMQRALDGLDGPAGRLAAQRGRVIAAVRLVDDPRPVMAGVPAGVRVLARFDAGPATGSRVLVVAGRDPGIRLRLLAAGEAAVVSGRLRPLEGSERRQRWRHAAAALDARDVLAVDRARPPALRLANHLRSLVLAGHDDLPEPRRSLVAGFVVGDDRDLPPVVAADFRAAGLSHLLAVSGANVALALALAGPLLQRFSLTGRFLGGLAVVAVFAAMTRFEPSVSRASAMAALALVAGFLGRPASGLRLLGLAGTSLVLVDPFLVHSVGFALSCGASAGILLLAGPLAVRLPGPVWFRQPLAVTAAAQVGVLPVAIPLFGGVPLVALPANLLAGPAAAAIGLCGMAAGLAGGVVARWSPELAVPLGWPAGVLAAYVREVARLAARFPLALSGRAALGLGLGIVAVLAAVRIRRVLPPTPAPRRAIPGPGR